MSIPVKYQWVHQNINTSMIPINIFIVIIIIVNNKLHVKREIVHNINKNHSHLGLLTFNNN